MARESDIFGISKFEFGDPGDGIMGTTLTEFNDIAEASATFSVPVGEITRIFSETEQSSPYRSFVGRATEGYKLELSLLGIDMDEFAGFFGGTYDAPSATFSFPNDRPAIYKSVKLTTKVTDAAGHYLEIKMPYALVTTGIEGALTYNALATIKVILEGNIPVSALGVKGAALQFTLVTP